LGGTGFWGFVTMIAMARTKTNTWLDTTPLTKNPARTAAWFLMGVSIAALVKAMTLEDSGYDNKAHTLHLRVSQNEHTHSLLRNIKFHLATRKMSVWDANP
jgi:hypothetical protein